MLAAVFVPAGSLALVALSSKNADFRRAALRWFIPLALVWFAPCWLAGRSPVAFDLLEGWLRPWKGPAPFAMTGNGLLADVPLQFVPWRELVTESWLSGELPALNRYAGAGSPLWSNPQAAVLAPATILGLAFSSFAWPLFAAVLRLLTALCGMYLFMRGEKVSHSGALVSAIAWGLGAGLTAFALFPHANVISLLPFLLLAISRAVERDGPRGVAWASLVLAMMLLGGHAESVLHCAVAAIPWAIRAVVLRSEGHVRAAARCLALGVLGLMLAAPAIVPFAFQLPWSERLTRLETERSLAAAPRLSVDNVIPFVLPAHYFHSKDAAWDGDNFNEAATQYAGLLSLVLAITAIFVAPARVRFWAILAAACLPLAFEWAGTSMLGDWLPWFDKVLHGRLRFVIALALAAAAGHGFDAVVARARGAVRVMGIATALAILALVLAALANRELYASHDTLVRVLVAGAAAVVTAAVAAVVLYRGGAAIAIVPLLLFVDLCASLVDYNGAVGRERYYPDRPSLRALADGGRATRVLALGGGLMPNSGAMYGLEQVGVNDPMAYEPFLALLRSGGYDMRHYFNRFDRLPPRILLDYLGVSRIVLAPGARVEGLPEA
ncbi:MAG: hypothetical protein NDJ92_13600, partial [Thermoanaerobaculia bacterium]|nr:hypothetical protein [Thermoanaerobaculia bacterium]